MTEITNFTITAHNRESFCAKVIALPLDTLYVANIIERKSKRSKDQQDWARKYARDFGKHFGYEADEAYQMLMWKHNPVFIDDGAGNQIRLPGHFSKLDTAKAADVQDAMLRYGIDLGFFWDE